MRRLLAAAAALTLILPVQAQGQALSTQFGPTADVRMDDLGAKNVATWGGVVVGPYGGTLLSGGPTQPSIALYCVDFINSVSVGQSWTVNVTGLGAGADLANTRLSTGAYSGDALERYRKAAYLASLFESNTSRSSQSAIHAAIWTVMTPDFPNLARVNDPAGASAAAAPFLSQASTAAAGGFAGFDFSEWRILSDVNGGSQPVGGKQEFLTRVVSVPEPGTWLIALSGLGLLGLVGWRRRDDLLEGTSV